MANRDFVKLIYPTDKSYVEGQYVTKSNFPHIDPVRVKAIEDTRVLKIEGETDYQDLRKKWEEAYAIAARALSSAERYYQETHRLNRIVLNNSYNNYFNFTTFGLGEGLYLFHLNNSKALTIYYDPEIPNMEIELDDSYGVDAVLVEGVLHVRSRVGEEKNYITDVHVMI